MANLKDQLQQDLTESIRAKDSLRSGTIRMVLTAITNEEVAGKEARELSDDDVITVLSREAKKRRESATAYDDANRPELAARERDELEIIATYLPAALSEDELAAIIATAVSEVAANGQTGPSAMGAVMKLVSPQIAGRADGGAVAAAVKAALA